MEEDDEQPIPDGYSGDGYLVTLEEIEYELHEAKATRCLCRRYGRNGKEKQEQLVEYDRRIDRLNICSKTLRTPFVLKSRRDVRVSNQSMRL